MSEQPTQHLVPADNTREVAAEEPLEGRRGGRRQEGTYVAGGRGTSQHAGPVQGQWSLPERDRSLVEHSSLSKVLQRPVLSLNWNGIGDTATGDSHT